MMKVTILVSIENEIYVDSSMLGAISMYLY